MVITNIYIDLVDLINFWYMLIGGLFFLQAEDGIRDADVTGVQTCALPIWGRRPGRFGQGAQRARAEHPLVPRRFGGSRTVEQDHPDVRGRGRLPGREPGRKEPALRHPRARDGRDRERACAVEAPGVRRDVLHLQRLRAARHPAVGRDGAAHDLRLHARRHGGRRGRANPPARGAARVEARHPWADHPAAGRRQRGRRGLPVCHAAPPRARCPGAVAAAPPDAGSKQIRSRERRHARRLHPRRRARRQAGSHPHRLRERGESRRRGSREAACRRDPLARGLDAVLGHLRAPDAGVSGQRAAAQRDGPRRGGAGLDAGMGALRRDLRPRHRHADVRGVRTAQGAAEEVRISAGPRGRGGQGTAGPVIAEGSSSPLGATCSHEGVNFSVFSRHATGVELLLFEGVDDREPSRAIRLDPGVHSTYFYWHVFVHGVRPGQLYGYRVEGPFDPETGMRFDPTKVLLDPYGRGVAVPEGYSRDAAQREGDNAATAMKSVVMDPGAYDWEGDAPLRRPPAQTIVYEMHVRGFTRHPSSRGPEKTRGTFAGLIEKIPYLRDLGITAVDLLPVFQFDAQDCPPGLVNYWGYSPVSFFAPHQAYSSRLDRLGPIDEFRDMVKALHRAGIEVILDVVFHHTH